MSQVVNAKEKFLKEIKSASPVNRWIIRKWNSPSPTVDVEKVLVLCIDDQTTYNIHLSQSLIRSKVLTPFNSVEPERGK